MAQRPNELQGAPGQGLGAMANPAYFSGGLTSTLAAMRNSKSVNNAFPDPVDNPEAGPITKFVPAPDQPLGVKGADQNTPMFNGSFVTTGQGNRGSADMMAGDGHMDLPSRAATTAGEAAALALGGKQGGGNIDQASDSAGAQGGDPAIAARLAANDAGSVKSWNDFTKSQIANISGLSPEKTGQVLAQPLPQWAKTGADGGGTTNFDTKTGDAARVNAGYGTEIIRQGKTSVRDTGDGQLHERSNSFSGVGRGEMPEGAAGVFGETAPGMPGAAGTGTAQHPFEQVQQHLMGIMQQAAQKRAHGDFLGARGLESHAMKMSQMFQTLSAHMYQTGLLSNAERETTLRENVAKPGIETGSIIADQMKNGDLATASQAAAAGAGHPINAPTAVMQGIPYLNPFTGKPYDADTLRALQAQSALGRPK